jgi:hypothetical protein
MPNRYKWLFCYQMQSKKLYELLKELNASEAKNLIWASNQRTDKRFRILVTLIKNRNLVYDSFIVLFIENCARFYKSQNKGQIMHTARRLSDFFCQQIENVIFEYTDLAARARYMALGKHFRKKGNSFLSEIYFEKSYYLSVKAGSNEDLLGIIPNIISLNFVKGSIESFKRGLTLNESLNHRMEVLYHKTKVDYYNNISNIYLDNNTLGEKSNTELIAEINQYIKQVKNPELIVGYRISQMRLSFGTSDFSLFSNLTDSFFKQLESTENVEILYRKYLFLKLVLGFYSGAPSSDLIREAELIRTINQKSSFVDNYTIFYLVILYIIQGEKEKAQMILKAENLCFKQNTKYLRDFIDGFEFFTERDFQKAKRKFNKLLDIDDYFIEQFSRLFLVSIYFKLHDLVSFASMLRTCERKVKSNPEKGLINPSTIFLVGVFKQISIKGRKEVRMPETLSSLHRFLLLSVI